jgi:hypothetical protein
MKTITKFSVLVAFIIATCVHSAIAQTKADIFNPKTKITWLGLDFSQTKFIGSEAAYKATGELINSDFVNRYIPAWANLFITEPTVYNVAKAVHRDSVHFALQVTEKANAAITKNFFDDKPSDFSTLKEQDITELVKNYDFQGQKGIGMLFFVDGMSKATHSAGAWVTFVNMDNKTMILTLFRTGDSRGFGFRNYWAHSWFNILRNFKDDYDSIKVRY